jgi:hypothetical protein
MVWRGTTFKEIAGVLGHRSLDSTAIYGAFAAPAKVGLSALTSFIGAAI